MKLLLRIWPRLLLYTILIVVISCSVMYGYASNHSSLSDNFLAGSIEIAITVILIDGLLSIERKRRIKALNAGNANASTYYLGLIIVRFIKEFNFPIKPNELTVVGMSNADLRKIVNDFFESAQYEQYLQNVGNAKKGMIKKLEKISEFMSEWSSRVRKSLEKSQPYPDPALMKLISDEQPNIIASVRVAKVMYDLVDIVRNGDSSEESEVARRIVFDEMERMSKRSLDEEDGSNLHKAFNDFLDMLLIIHERSEKNSLHYDV